MSENKECEHDLQSFLHLIKFIASQESLGFEFKKVYYDNAWDLYE